MLHTLSHKVTITASTFLALLLVFVMLVTASVFGLQRTTSYLTDETIPQLNVIGETITVITHAHGELDAFLLSGERTHLTEAEQLLAEASTELAEIDALIAPDTPIISPQLNADVRKIRDELQAVVSETNTVLTDAARSPASQQPALLNKLHHTHDTLEELHPSIDALLASHTTAVTTRVAQETRQTLLLVVVLCIAALTMVLLAVWMVRRRIIGPVRALSAATAAVARGTFDQAITNTSNDELGQLQRDFNTMAVALRDEQTLRTAQIAQVQAAHTEAETARAAMAAHLATIEQQQAIIREMSVPILPLSATTQLMPLVGSLDGARLTMVQEHALRAIERRPTRYFILDITGVPLIDTHVAQGLIRVIQAARLLGTRVVVVGIRPEIAQTLVTIGVQFEGVVTRSTLEEGIGYTQLGQHAAVHAV